MNNNIVDGERRFEQTEFFGMSNLMPFINGLLAV